jgi:hypothetical protein
MPRPRRFFVIFLLGILLGNLPVVFVQPFTDPRGDLFDINGQPVRLGRGDAIITFSANTTHYRFMKGSSPVYSVAISTHSSSRSDYFVVQVYVDGSRTVFSMWGIAETGTYASGIYFADTIYPNIATYTKSYYVCKWTDLNNDRIQQSNEISVVASGT